MGVPDIGTLRLGLGFAGLLSLVVTAALWRGPGRVAGMEQWLLAALLSAIAYLLPPAVQWGRPDLGIAINSGLTLSAMLLMLDGALTLRGFGEARRRRGPVIMACLAILALMLMSAGQVRLRVSLHDGLAFLMLTGTALALVWRAPRWSWPAAGSLGLLFAVMGLLLLWRGMVTAGGGEAHPPAWLLAATLAWVMGWTALLPLLAAVTEAERLRRQAERDGLTGLASRLAFLRQALPVPGRRDGLLLLGLEDLRTLNVNMGHGAGDRMLVAFAARLREAAGPEALIGRLTGAQFALLLPGIGDRADLMARVCRLQAALSVPLAFGDLAQVPEFTLGAALAPEDGKNAERLLEAAERAIFRVRAAQRRD